jgi:hypothetical protein
MGIHQTVSCAYGRGICLQRVHGNKAANIVTRETASCGNLSSVDNDVCTYVHQAVVHGWLDKWTHARQQIESFEIFCASAAVFCLKGRAPGFKASDQPYLLDTQIFVMWREHLFSIFLTHYTPFLGMMIMVGQMFWHFKAFCNLLSWMCFTTE